MSLQDALPAGWLDHPLVQRLVSSSGVLPQLVRYGAVSVAALGCDFVLFLALTKGDVKPALAGAAGYCLGLVLHFVLSTLLVFDTRAARKPMARLFGEFALSGGVGLVLTASIITIMTSGLGASPVIAKTVAVLVSFLAVFMLRRTIVFASHQAITTR